MRRRRSRAGQSMVEMAMIAPVLIVMLVTVLDFGRAAYAYTVLSDAVRDGARVAVRTGQNRPANVDVTAAVQRYANGVTLNAGPCVNGYSSGGLTAPTAPNTGYIYIVSGSGSSTVNAPGGQPAAGASGSCAAVNPAFGGTYPLSVTVVYSFQPLTPFGQQFFGGTIVISVTSTMTTEY